MNLPISFVIRNAWDKVRTFLKEKNFSVESSQNRYRYALVLDVLCIALVLLQGPSINSRFLSPLSSFWQQKSVTASPGSVILPNGEEIKLANLHGLFTENNTQKDLIVKKAHGFMHLPPDSKTRLKKEMELLKTLKKKTASASDVLLAAHAVITIPARAYSMEMLWEMRQNGDLVKYHILPLSERNISWAKERDIDPRMLGIAIDTYGYTLKLIEAKPELFLEAADSAKQNDTNKHKYVPSPAVVAKLQMMETGWDYLGIIEVLDAAGLKWDFTERTEGRGFVNIGSERAWDALNLTPSWFPSGQEDLIWIAKEHEKSTGLPYVKNVTAIPGSFRGYGDGSGGAIGPQFMPINARLFMTWYKEANKSLGNTLPEPNLFNPWTGTLLSSLYLSSEFYHRQLDINDVLTDVKRPGYEVLNDEDVHVAFTREDPRMSALLKWNPLMWEARAAVKAGEEFNEIWYAQNLFSRKD